MDGEELATRKADLQRQRRVILETAQRAQQELEALRNAERDPEFEEGAQTEHEEYTLRRLGEAQLKQIELIDGALARIEAGEYGFCQDCGIDINPKRLEVLPFAAYCTDCATRRERGTLPASGVPTL